uniref:Uncharacterized protein n=1 Tax=Noccaea caerulescens TaxID=107243 RepID=A0A1J3HWH8_NOCCA
MKIELERHEDELSAELEHLDTIENWKRMRQLILIRSCCRTRSLEFVSTEYGLEGMDLSNQPNNEMEETCQEIESKCEGSCCLRNTL